MDVHCHCANVVHYGCGGLIPVRYMLRVSYIDSNISDISIFSAEICVKEKVDFKADL